MERNNYIFLYRGVLCHVTAEEVNCKSECICHVTMVTHALHAPVVGFELRKITLFAAAFLQQAIVQDLFQQFSFCPTSRVTSVWKPSCRSSAKKYYCIKVQKAKILNRKTKSHLHDEIHPTLTTSLHFISPRMLKII